MSDPVEQMALDPTECFLMANGKKMQACNMRQDFIRDYAINHTLSLGDAGATIHCTKGSAQVITVPSYGTCPFRVGTTIGVIWEGVGAVTITAAAGVTLNGAVAGSGLMSARYGMVLLIKRGTNTWVVAGSIGTVA